ncbi:protein kinase domain-containing protein [Streptomyces sp. IB201691-2A2]|uniref:serine/threonine-protein kinase n=1 Tax=Streptomyces sp. IB201691-2A2 TaxID=2561920 RepID=UPI001180964D|nr:serine/threonine-protein kinase [Streptomyces sp. IB201691-2A2]TRO58175.1 serine/threonine-protein kinase [Streptomyces sp. IB201691-2A2]
MTTALHPEDPRQLGRHHLIARLGAGGMGQVYLARSPGGRLTAVKTIHEHLAADPHYRERFRREATAARRVTGAYTAPVLDADPDALLPWLATTFLPGVTLSRAVAKTGPLSAPAVCALAAALAEALRDIHAAGLVHRDLKPSNILVTRDGPRVIDFGIARAQDDRALTETGGMIGTPGYMSPEQILDGPAVTAATDIFALGAVLTFAATGRNAFGAASVPALLYQIVHEEPELDDVPVELGLKDLIDACLDKSPGNRPDAAAILHRLVTPAPSAWWREEPLRSLVADAEVTPHPRPEPMPAPTVRLPGPAPSRRGELSRRAALAAGSAALVGLFGYAVAQGGGADDQDEDPDAWKVTGGTAAPGAIRWRLSAGAGRVDALLSTPAGLVLHGLEGTITSAGSTQLRTASTGGLRWTAETHGDVPDDWGVTDDGLLLAGGIGLAPTATSTGKTLSKAAMPESTQQWYALAGTVMVIREMDVLRAVSLTSGTELWRREQLTEWRRPAVVGDALLLTDEVAHPTCVDAREGQELWTYRELGKGDTVTAVGALPPDRFALLTEKGTLHVIDARSGDRTAARALKTEIARGATALARTGTAGLLLTGSTLHGFGLDDARLAWSTPAVGLDACWTRLPGGVHVPVVAGGLLLHWKDGHTLTALDPRTGQSHGRAKQFEDTGPAQCPPAVAPDGTTVYAAAGRACAALRTTAKDLTETHTRTAPAPVTSLTADTRGWYACAGRKTVIAVNG